MFKHLKVFCDKNCLLTGSSSRTDNAVDMKSNVVAYSNKLLNLIES